MNARELLPPPHMEAADLDGDTKVTIAAVDTKEVGEEKVVRPVLYTEELQRDVVINRTNLKRIIEWHGAETDDWIGKAITLYPSETDFGGNTVPCIRVRQKK